jgi:hypothetical protein
MKKTREEIAEGVRFLQDAYWESLDDLDEATRRVVEGGGWTLEEWYAVAQEPW